LRFRFRARDRIIYSRQTLNPMTAGSDGLRTADLGESTKATVSSGFGLFLS
jgi:hypothetical protein